MIGNEGKLCCDTQLEQTGGRDDCLLHFTVRLLVYIIPGVELPTQPQVAS